MHYSVGMYSQTEKRGGLLSPWPDGMAGSMQDF